MFKLFLSNYLISMNPALVKTQALYRGYILRKHNKILNDNFDINLLKKCINVYKNTINNEKNANKKLKNKKIRLSNFPSHISENIAKFAICHKYKIMPLWDTDKGDLIIKKNNIFRRIEVKGSINLNNGPCTFGPKEEWDCIYFIDGLEFEKDIYKIYECKLSNKSDIWKNIKVNKTQTYEEQCLQKRRPRITFAELQKQLNSNCSKIFEGNLDELFI